MKLHLNKIVFSLRD